MIPTVSVDAMVARAKLSRLDLIKIDVDGADYDVLLGSKETLARFHPVVIIEMHNNQRQIYGLLKETGYSWLVGMRGEPVEPGEWPPNLIAADRPISIPARGSFTAQVEADNR